MHNMDETIQRYLDRSKLLEDIEIMNTAQEATILSAAKSEASLSTDFSVFYYVSGD
jgi:hypothetical protein